MRAKGLTERIGGSSRRKLTQVRVVTLTKIGSCNENSLRLVTSRDSRIKFGIGATTRLYFQRQGGPCGSKHRIFFRSIQRHRFGWCLRNK